MRRTLQAIDTVHGTGNDHLPRIPIEAESHPNRFGAYGRTIDGRPVRIRIEVDGDHKALTTAHEVGHFLDHQALGIPGTFASEANPRVLVSWQNAVDASQTLFQLRAMASTGIATTRQADGTVSIHAVDLTYVSQLIRPREMWARSYAQYIATRSADPSLGLQLASERERHPGMPYYPEHWDDEDFAPIAEAIDELLESKGWRA